MEKIRLGSEEIKYITLFETLTGATIKDCVQESDRMGFLVKDGGMGLAIGKGGANIKKVRGVIGKEIIVMEFSDNLPNFIKNLFQPINIKEVRIQTINNEKTAIIGVSRNDRGKVIGYDGVRIKIAKKLAKRHYGIDDIKINNIR